LLGNRDNALYALLLLYHYANIILTYTSSMYIVHYYTVYRLRVPKLAHTYWQLSNPLRRHICLSETCRDCTIYAIYARTKLVFVQTTGHSYPEQSIIRLVIANSARNGELGWLLTKGFLARVRLYNTYSDRHRSVKSVRLEQHQKDSLTTGKPHSRLGQTLKHIYIQIGNLHTLSKTPTL